MLSSRRSPRAVKRRSRESGGGCGVRLPRRSLQSLPFLLAGARPEQENIKKTQKNKTPTCLLHIILADGYFHLSLHHGCFFFFLFFPLFPLSPLCFVIIPRKTRRSLPGFCQEICYVPTRRCYLPLFRLVFFSPPLHAIGGAGTRGINSDSRGAVRLIHSVPSADLSPSFGAQI